MALELALVLAALPLSGCVFFPLFDRDRGNKWEEPEPPPPQPPPPAAIPPSFGTVTIPDWPPLGKDTSMSVSVSDVDANLSAVLFEFNRSVQRDVSGGAATTSVTGAELGEGFGTLTITASDTTGAWARKTVTELLVDLTAPKITLGQTTVPADGELELWVGDAWILGRVELSFGGTLLVHEFEKGFPETLGTTWDYSLVEFDMAQLPPGEGEASIRAVDAAGNSVVESFTLIVDSEPPAIAITSPADGAVLSGSVVVELAASDPGGGPVWVELFANGTPIATATGPTATVKLDSGELTPGATALVAKAIDRAGNTSTATRSVMIQ
jgi:hypothetical protein